MTNETTDGLDIARLGTIPHGDSVLALSKSDIVDAFNFSKFHMSGLPIVAAQGPNPETSPTPSPLPDPDGLIIPNGIKVITDRLNRREGSSLDSAVIDVL